MSDDISHSKTFIEGFEFLHIDEDIKESVSYVSKVANSTHDLSCRMPQTAGDMDNSDDTNSESDSESDIIVVVDSSDAPLEVSFIRPSDLSTNTDSEISICDSDTNTIPETESDTNGSPTGPSIMDNLVSTPIKRKHETYSSSKDKQSPIATPDQRLGVNSTPSLTTRSGRAVRQRLDQKFDYSSQSDLSLDDTYGDPDFRDNDDEYDSDGDEDDDDDDEDYKEQESVEPIHKQRRISFRSSYCSSSNSSSTTETDAIVYLDLRHAVAIVSSEPTSDPSVECDTALKTRLNKFLGLMPAQRRLYNPMSNYELQDNHTDEDNSPPMQSSRLWATSNSVQTSKIKAKTKAIASPMPSLLKRLGTEITNEMKILLIDDIVQRANANCFESQTPQHIKEPIDLSSLPSVEQRAVNCQQHKKIHNLLDPCAGYYSFLDSLRSETPINMCHPLAVDYRQRDFETSKLKLAKTLFNALNHTIFHCGLRPSISWKNSMSTPSSVVHGIESSGQRVSRIILWQHMKHPGVLVKALLHEMCHAAAFVYHGETGHGDNCRKWAYRAKSLLPELPQIDDCNANYKYTCLLCGDRSYGIMKFENEEQQLRCYYCQFEVNAETYNIEDAHNISLTDQLATPYKQFMRANYTKCEESSHSSKMRALNIQYKEQLQQSSSN